MGQDAGNRGTAVMALLGVLAACRPADRSVDLQRLAGLAVPAEYRLGDSLYAAHCANCHGPQGVGSDSGPPLVHRYYQPDHHADAAFLMAVARGVRAHHWRYGDMPPTRGVTPEQAQDMTAYVRWLQREAGIR